MALDVTFTTLTSPALPPGTTLPTSGYLETDEKPNKVRVVSLEAMRNIELQTMSRILIDEEGNLTYESRYARNA
jgi:hypothetical protein